MDAAAVDILVVVATTTQAEKHQVYRHQNYQGPQPGMQLSMWWRGSSEPWPSIDTTSGVLVLS